LFVFLVTGRHLRCSTRITAATSIRRFCFICNQIWFSAKSLPASCGDKGFGQGSPIKLQSRQSARLFLQSSELELPHSLTSRRVCSPFFGSGVGVPIQTRGQTLWYSRYIFCGPAGFHAAKDYSIAQGFQLRVM
jgi:hypothetical protein